MPIHTSWRRRIGSCRMPIRAFASGCGRCSSATVKPGEEQFIDVLRRKRADPVDRPKAEAEIMLRKNWSAMGSFVNEDRPHALDLLGFSSQLVFNTFLSKYFVDLEHKHEPAMVYGVARAHNRAMTDFCAVDRRLLAVGYVPLADFDQARAMAAEAIAMGCNALLVPSACPAGPLAQSHGFVPGVGDRRRKRAFRSCSTSAAAAGCSIPTTSRTACRWSPTSTAVRRISARWTTWRFRIRPCRHWRR